MSIYEHRVSTCACGQTFVQAVETGDTPRQCCDACEAAAIDPCNSTWYEQMRTRIARRRSGQVKRWQQRLTS